MLVLFQAAAYLVAAVALRKVCETLTHEIKKNEQREEKRK